MLVSKEGMVMIQGNEVVVLAEMESLLTSFYVNLRNHHGEDVANELFAEVGRRAIEGVDGWEDHVVSVDGNKN